METPECVHALQARAKMAREREERLVKQKLFKEFTYRWNRIHKLQVIDTMTVDVRHHDEKQICAFMREIAKQYGMEKYTKFSCILGHDSVAVEYNINLK